MSAMASQFTSLTIVNPTVYSGGAFPAQRARNAENVSIEWRHDVQSNLVVWGIITTFKQYHLINGWQDMAIWSNCPAAHLAPISPNYSYEEWNI